MSISTDSAREEARWLRDTTIRISLRYGRALHELSMLPGLITLTTLWTDPYAGDVQNAADAIATSVRGAIAELERLAEYAEAITEPGPATCQTCGADLSMFHGHEDWRHYRLIRDADSEPFGRVDLFEVDHPPALVWAPPPRPNWSTDDTDLTPDHHQTRDDQDDARDDQPGDGASVRP